MFELAKAIHEAIGTDSPRLFMVLFALIGLFLFGGVGWLVDKGYRVELREEVAQAAIRRASNPPIAEPPKAAEISTAELPKPVEARSRLESTTGTSESGWIIPGIIPFPKPQHGPSKLPSGLPGRGTPANSAGDNSDATAAVEHYRKTSILLKRQEIRDAYLEYCNEIASTFKLPDWSPKNQLTRMVSGNAGDTEPLKRADEQIPNTAWAAVRVLVAFETESARPMYMSYIFIGRTPSGDEVLALFDADKQWKILSRSSNSNDDPRRIMIAAINQELKSLTDKIAPEIRRLN